MNLNLLAVVLDRGRRVEDNMIDYCNYCSKETDLNTDVCISCGTRSNKCVLKNCLEPAYEGTYTYCGYHKKPYQDSKTSYSFRRWVGTLVQHGC